MKFRRFLKFLTLTILAIVLFILLTNIVIYFGAKPYIYKNIEDVPESQVALIPGAAISSKGELSSIFKDRVNTAIDLYKTGKAEKILVSGDNSTVSHNEVNPVRNYLLGKGIPDSDIFLDHAGFDTYSTMYRARDIFQVSSIIVSTQSFHLPRSVFLARMLGIKAYGVSADAGHILFKNYIREMLANEKAVLNLIFHRKPKFLGSVIPIGENGKESTNPIPVEESTDGFLTGHIDIGPFCPVETLDNPCKVPPEAYSSREVIIYKSDGITIKEKVKIDAKGDYKIALASGTYFVQVKPAGIGEGEKKPATVKPSKTTVVDFDIDTGIR